jgi:hypothetical protein
MMERLRLGDKIAAGGAIVLFVSLFLPWFQLTLGSTVLDQALESIGARSVNAFKAFDVLDILLLLIAVAVVAGLLLIASDKIDASLRRGLESAGVVAVIAILWGMFDNARQELIGLRYGAFVGLIGAAAIAVGGYVNRRDGVV